MSPLWVVERGVKRRKPRRSGGSQMLRGNQVSPSPMCDVEESQDEAGVEEKETCRV